MGKLGHSEYIALGYTVSEWWDGIVIQIQVVWL